MQLTDKNGIVIKDGDWLEGANSNIYRVFDVDGVLMAKLDRYFEEDDGIDAQRDYPSAHKLIEFELCSITVMNPTSIIDSQVAHV